LQKAINVNDLFRMDLKYQIDIEIDRQYALVIALIV